MQDTSSDDATPLRELGRRLISTNPGGHLTFYHRDVRWWPRWFQIALVRALAAARSDEIVYACSALDEEKGGQIFLLTERVAILLTVSPIDRDFAEVVAATWSRSALTELCVIDAEQTTTPEGVQYTVSRMEVVYAARAPLRLPLGDRWDRDAAAGVNRLYGDLLEDLIAPRGPSATGETQPRGARLVE